MDIHKRKKTESDAEYATIEHRQPGHQVEDSNASVAQLESALDAEVVQQSISASVNTPQRVRSRRKRVKLALNDWNQLPAYLKDNE
jgi:hypothetical protein